MAIFGPCLIFRYQQEILCLQLMYLATADKNAMYTSPDIQNQIIGILDHPVRETILKKVRSSLCYTLIADEVTDCSNKEQLCIVLRYVESMTSVIKEDLVTILECDSGITGEALADLMLGFVRENLDPSMLHGQAYDGAAGWQEKWSCCSNSHSISPHSIHALCFSLPKFGSCSII